MNSEQDKVPILPTEVKTVASDKLANEVEDELIKKDPAHSVGMAIFGEKNDQEQKAV